MRVLLIGCGNIGNILLEKWSCDSDITEIVVVQPSLSKRKYFCNVNKISFVKESSEISSHFRPKVIVVAVKPQNVYDVLPEYRHFVESLVISLCVAISVNCLSELLDKNEKIVRLMPNIALSIGKSANLVYSRLADSISRRITEVLFKSMGSLIWLLKEELFDDLSPITGCAPAYFYSLLEELIDNAIKCGLDDNIAAEALKQTFIGSAMLLQRGQKISSLKDSIASKGGITAESLKVLTSFLPEVIERSLDAAQDRLKRMREESQQK